MLTYTNRKPNRGHAAEFHKLDTDIKWLNYKLGSCIIRDDFAAIESFRGEIETKMKIIEAISKQK